MAKEIWTGVKAEEASTEIHCSALGLEYRSKMKKIIRIMEIPDERAELDIYCGSTAAEFKSRLAGIGTHIPAAGIAAVVVEFLKGAVATAWEFLKGGLH